MNGELWAIVGALFIVPIVIGFGLLFWRSKTRSSAFTPSKRLLDHDLGLPPLPNQISGETRMLDNEVKIGHQDLEHRVGPRSPPSDSAASNCAVSDSAVSKSAVSDYAVSDYAVANAGEPWRTMSRPELQLHFAKLSYPETLDLLAKLPATEQRRILKQLGLQKAVRDNLERALHNNEEPSVY